MKFKRRASIAVIVAMLFTIAFAQGGLQSYRFAAIRNPSTENRPVTLGRYIDQIKGEYAQMWKNNMRLIDLQAFVMDGDVHYNAVWGPSSEGQVVVFDWTPEAFAKKYDEIWI
jgi:hypothetical protein